MWQNMDFWIFAVSGAIAMLAALYLEIFHGPSGVEEEGIAGGIATALYIAIFLMAFSGSMALQNRVPFPPFTWLRWLHERVPSDCRDGCIESIPYDFALMFLLVPVGLVCIAFVWGPSWLIRSLRRR